jgi:hypothetical protein
MKRWLALLTLVTPQFVAMAGEWYWTEEGCQIWDNYSITAIENFTWTGDCSEGLAGGVCSLTKAYIDGNWQRVMDRYFGPMRAGKFNGHGTYYLADSSRHVGEWKDSMMHGQGIFYRVSGDRYIGEWRNGEKFGQGALFRADGSRYEGEFKSKKFHGEGIYYEADGDKRAGYFQDNVLLRGWYYYVDGTQCEVIAHQPVETRCLNR